MITLFGELSVTVNGQTRNAFRSNKARALLVYLLLTHPRPVARTALCELLWPDYTSKSAQVNLRQSLVNLRALFAPFGLLQADRQRVQLTLDPATVWCDVCAFNELLATCQAHDHADLAHCPACQLRLQQVVALVHAALLEHFPETDNTPFMRWLQDQRACFAARLAEAQAALVKEKTSPGNLPPALTPLLGRAADLADLTDKVQHLIYRCVSIVGPGGIGKTRLACAVGDQLRHHFSAGVWLVELSALAPASAGEPLEQVQDRIATAVATTLGLTLHGATPPAIQVAQALADRAMLLILDSFEHLTAGAAWLPTLLTAAPHLRLLITTRHRLPLQSQLVYQVHGLAVPSAEEDDRLPTDQCIDRWIAQYASVQLFMERAESAQRPLPRQAATMATISQLCRFVDGSPWAIEVAVSLLNQQGPVALLQAIQNNYRVLATGLLDVPERQRSAEAVFQTAWQLLTPSEAQALARCAVFRGGFTVAAAQTVAAATPATLEALVYKSLLSSSGADRYAMHDLVRQFVAEQLAHEPKVQSTILARHAAYYIGLLQSQEIELYNKADALKRLQNELDNIRAAWRWSTEQGNLALLEQGAGSLQDFYRLAGSYTEALQLLTGALAAVRQASVLSTTATGGPDEAQRLLARLLCYMTQFYRMYRRADEVQKGELCAQEALVIGHNLADPALIGLAYHELARLADAQTDYVKMGLLAEKACCYARQANLPHLTAECLNDLGIAAGNSTQPLAGIPHFQAALACLHQQPNRSLEVRITGNLGGFYLAGHAYQAAYQYIQHSHNLRQSPHLRHLLQYRENSLLGNIWRGDLWMALGAYPEAQQEYAQGFTLAQARRTPYWASWLHTSYGRLQHLCGDPAAAQITCRLARQVAQEDSHRFIAQRALINLGHALADLGELVEAGQCYRQAIAAHPAGNWLFRLPDAQAGLAAILLAQNEPMAALTHVEDALAHLAHQGLAAAGEPFGVYWTCVRVLAAVGDPRTSTVLATAYQALQACATELVDEQLRHSFLHTVSANRQLLAAAHATGIA